MIKEKLRGFIQGELVGPDGGAVSDDDELLVDGIIDSLGVIRLIGYIDDEFGLAVEPEETTIENFRSIEVVAGFVEKRLNNS